MYVHRSEANRIKHLLNHFPAVAILGPRQSGKSTLARQLINKIENTIYLDLEKISDRNRLSDPELFFKLNRRKLICLDEIQRLPEIFKVLRSVIDENERNGQFLILGSASRDLIRQSSETLAGRIIFTELSPFTLSEVKKKNKIEESLLLKFWNRGGFPRSYLAADDGLSFTWRQSFINTFLERDIPQLEPNIPPETLMRLWKMCSHNQGQLLNASAFGSSLGLSHTTVKKYLDLLQGTYMVRILKPYHTNFKKRMIKSPKIYIRDTGVLHTLLKLESINELHSHPVFGPSWETLVIENVLNKYSDWEAAFYRTSNGIEIDLVLEKGNQRIAIECKASTAPKLTRGFYSALEDLKVQKAWIIALVGDTYPLKENVFVTSLDEFLRNDLSKG